jgi:hypothetical protein
MEQMDWEATAKSLEENNTELQALYEATIEDIVKVKEERDKLSQQLVELSATNTQLHKSMMTFPTTQAFVAEVSQFHREHLLTLVDLVQLILKNVTPEAGSAEAQAMARVKGYLQTVENRAKHFEMQPLVQETRQKLTDELRGMTVKK